MNKNLKRQLNLVYLYTFFGGMMFWFGIEQLFFEQIGDGNFARGVNLTVVSVVFLFANIPAGAIADIWGRVRLLRLGAVFWLVSLVILAVSDSVLTYSIGAAFFAVYIAFNEGSQEAFMYDLLKDNKLEGEYEKVLGRKSAALLFGAALANFASGPIAELTSLRFNYVLSLVPALIAFALTLKLVEPKHHKNTGQKMLHQFDDVFRQLKVSKLLLLFTVAQAFIWMAAELIQEFGQPVILEYTDSATKLGVAWGILGLMMALGFLYIHKVKYVFPLFVGLFGLYALYLMNRDSPYSLIPLGIAAAGFYAVSIKGENALQMNAPSHLRATAISVAVTFSLILTITSSIWIGQSEGSVSNRVAAVSIPMLVITLGLYWYGRKSLRKAK